METISIDCGVVSHRRDARAVIMKNQRLLKSPCFIELNTSNGKRQYYAEKSNVGVDGAGWIVVERGIQGV